MAAPAWRSPIRERRPGQPRPTLALAFGAEKGRAPTLDDSFHRAPAGAGLALAIIDGEILGEIAEVAVGTDEIAQGRATGSDRLFEHGGDRFGQRVELCPRHFPRRFARVDPRPGRRPA